MKEHLALFTGESMIAMRDGRKTQTRRVIVPQPPPAVTQVWMMNDGAWAGMVFGDESKYAPNPEHRVWFRCPYGVPGDMLYWANEPIEFIGINSLRGDMRQEGVIKSLFDGVVRTVRIPDVDDMLKGRRIKRPKLGRWRGRRLPIEWVRDWRWLVTHVRVERVQDISEVDAIAEGKQPITGKPPRIVCGEAIDMNCTARELFRDLWDSINHKRGYGFETNSWVYAVTFRRQP